MHPLQDHRELEAFPETFSPGLNATELRDAAHLCLLHLLRGPAPSKDAALETDRHCLLHLLKLGHLPALLDWAIALSCSPGDSLLCGQ